MLKGSYIVNFSYSESRYCLVSILRLNSSRKMFLGKNCKIFNFIPRLLQLSCNCFTTKNFSWKLQCVSRLISRLPNPRKMRVFSFYLVDVTIFQTLWFSLALPLSNPSQPKINFHSNPIIFKQKSLQNHFKVCFPKYCFHFCLRLCRF